VGELQRLAKHRDDWRVLIGGDDDDDDDDGDHVTENAPLRERETRGGPITCILQTNAFVSWALDP